MGWIGIQSQLMHTLDTFGVDRDENGKIKWYGTPPSCFLGIGGDNAEVVVGDDAEVEINGQRRPVSGLLAQTSYGTNVTVIGG